MANAYVSNGTTIDITLGGAVSSGDIWRGVDRCGVYVNSGVTGDVVPVAMVGVFTVLKDSMATQWTAGDKIYANSSLEATPTATSSTPIGYAVGTMPATGAVLGTVLLGTF